MTRHCLPGLWCGVVAVASLGCDGTEGPKVPGHSTRQPVAPEEANGVVATVSGSVITSTDVKRVMQDLGISAAEALSRLEAERLLMGEAERLGFGRHRQVALVAKRAAVQALLAERVEAAEVSDAELEEAYQKHLDRFRRPELRGSVHVLAKLGRGASQEVSRAGERFAREAIAAFERAQDPESVLATFRKRESDLFEVVVERIPPIPKDAPFATEFKDAVFGRAKTGAVPHPVRTDFGWHAVVVTEIQPAKTLGLERAAEVLRPHLESEKRKGRLKELLSELRGRVKVVRNEATVDWALSADWVGAEGP